MLRIFHCLFFLLCGLPLIAVAETTQDLQKIPKVEPFSMISIMNMLMGVVVVIVLILSLAWVLKKYGRLPVNNQVEMKVVGGLSLGTRERAVLIEVDGQRLLLGVAPGRVDKLHVFGDHKTSFDEQLNQQMDSQS